MRSGVKIQNQVKVNSSGVLRRWLVPFLFFVLALFLVNSLIIDAGAPTQVGKKINVGQTYYFYKDIKDKNVDIVAVNSLRSGGLGGFSVKAQGYVDFFNSDDAIYVVTKGEPQSQKNYLLRHEYSHVVQKRLVAKVSGGYPVWWNPIRSAVYYYNLLRLNADLTRYTPDMKAGEKSGSFVPNIETNADCMAQTSGVFPSDVSYVGDNTCETSAYAAAYSIKAGKWPTADNVRYYERKIDDSTLQPLYGQTKTQSITITIPAGMGKSSVQSQDGKASGNDN